MIFDQAMLGKTLVFAELRQMGCLLICIRDSSALTASQSDLIQEWEQHIRVMSFCKFRHRDSQLITQEF
jgi:hypothetical protein